MESTSGAPPDRRISESEFAALLQLESVALFKALGGLSGRSVEAVSRAMFGELGHECHDLESFLDDHGARVNRRFALFTELVASLRSLANGGFALTHLRTRLDSYGSRAWGAIGDEVARAVEEAGSFVLSSCQALGHRLESEAKSLGCLPEDAMVASSEPEATARVRLPHDIGEDDDVDGPERVAELVARYLQGSDVLAELKPRALSEAAALREFVESKCREEQSRVYEATIHNLQSTYDTYIKNTALEASDRRLSDLRGSASAALHLLESLTHLAHFHERHESEKGAARAASVIAELVPRERVYETMVNRLLVSAHQVLETGRSLAEELLRDFTRVRELLVRLPEGVTLHARPVALLVGIVNHFGTPVEVEIGTRRCNAGSILEVLMAIGSQHEVAEFTFRGDERPLEHLALLFEHGLGELEGAPLPEALHYLRPN